MSTATKIFIGLVGVGAVAALASYGNSLNDTKLSAEELGNVTKLNGDQLGVFALRMLELSKGPFSGAMDDMLTKLQGMGESGVGAISRMRDAVAAAGGDTSKFDAALGGAKTSQDNLNTSTAAGAKVLGTEGTAFEETGDKAKTATEKIDDFISTQHAAIDPLFAMEKALRDNEAAQADLAKGGGDLVEKQIRVAETALQVNDAALRLDAAMKDGKVSTDGARQMLELWVAQGRMTQEAADAIADRLGIVIDDMNDLNGKRAAVTLEADTAAFFAALQRAREEIYNLQTLANRGIPVTAPSGVHIARAAGGPVRAGMRFEGAEEGLELLALPRRGMYTAPADGWVFSAGQSRQILNGVHPGALAAPIRPSVVRPSMSHASGGEHRTVEVRAPITLKVDGEPSAMTMARLERVAKRTVDKAIADALNRPS